MPIAPLMMAYLALMAASTGANMAAQRKVNKSRANVMADERMRRKVQQEKMNAAARNTADTFAQTADKENLRAAEVAEATRARGPAPVATTAGTVTQPLSAPTGSTTTVQAIEGEVNKARGEANTRNAALAKLSAFGDVMSGNNILAARNQQDIGQAAGFTQGWQQNVLPALLARANASGRDWATAADVMKLAATVMSPFALAKTGASEAATAAGEAAKATSLAQPPNMFDPYSWLRPSGSFPPLR